MGHHFMLWVQVGKVKPENLIQLINQTETNWWQSVRPGSVSKADWFGFGGRMSPTNTVG